MSNVPRTFRLLKFSRPAASTVPAAVPPPYEGSATQIRLRLIADLQRLDTEQLTALALVVGDFPPR